MTSTAGQIAAEIRRRSPGIGVMKLHKLLYYCQGHHLAGLGRPLFADRISAWDMGPVVGPLWYAEKQGMTAAAGDLGEAELNTIGYVLSRYGRLSARDLENMTHAESPWQRANEARPQSGSANIKREWIREYFSAEQGSDEDDGPWPDSDLMHRFVHGAERRRRNPARLDSITDLRARLVRRG